MISGLGLNPAAKMNFGKLTVEGKDIEGNPVRIDCNEDEPVRAFRRNYQLRGKKPGQTDLLLEFPDRKGFKKIIIEPRIIVTEVDISEIPTTGREIAPNGELSPIIND